MEDVVFEFCLNPGRGKGAQKCGGKFGFGDERRGDQFLELFKKLGIDLL
jgi:hypothetical protein